MLKKNIVLLLLGLIFLLSACGTQKNAKDDPYVKEIDRWHQKRIAALKQPDGWLSLAGLFWLKEGENRIGSAKTNDIRFPAPAPDYVGSVFLQNGKITIKFSPEAKVMVDSQLVREAVLKSDADGKPTKMQWGSLLWYVIKRGERYGIRLKNLEHPNLKSFKGIERFPVDPAWKITARLDTLNAPDSLDIPNVLGQSSLEPCPGALVFVLKGKEYRLYPVGGSQDKSWFLIFGDATNGEETYGAGRFLSVAAADKNRVTVIDFNKAYNPPCAFTPYATCPLPPKENVLPFAVTAGEKNYGHGNE
ncbi:MAG: DUF1684 domain-containing protein [Calditrichia bacterium]